MRILSFLVLSATICMMLNVQGDQAFAKSHRSSSSSLSGGTQSAPTQNLSTCPNGATVDLNMQSCPSASLSPSSPSTKVCLGGMRGPYPDGSCANGVSPNGSSCGDTNLSCPDPSSLNSSSPSSSSPSSTSTPPQPGGIIALYATMKPDNSNPFLHNQFTATLRHKLGFITSDINICPTGMKGLGTSAGCAYTLDNGIWRPNSFNSNMYVLEGTLKSSSQSGGNTNSKFFQIRADLTKTGEQTTANGLTIQNLTGTISFGNGVPDYSVLTSNFVVNNMTLVLVGITQYP